MWYYSTNSNVVRRTDIRLVCSQYIRVHIPVEVASELSQSRSLQAGKYKQDDGSTHFSKGKRLQYHWQFELGTMRLGRMMHEAYPLDRRPPPTHILLNAGQRYKRHYSKQRGIHSKHELCFCTPRPGNVET